MVLAIWFVPGDKVSQNYMRVALGLLSFHLNLLPAGRDFFTKSFRDNKK